MRHHLSTLRETMVTSRHHSPTLGFHVHPSSISNPSLPCFHLRVQVRRRWFLHDGVLDQQAEHGHMAMARGQNEWVLGALGTVSDLEALVLLAPRLLEEAGAVLHHELGRLQPAIPTCGTVSCDDRLSSPSA